MGNVLIVDDDPGIRVLISVIIRRKGGFNVTEAASVAEAKAFCVDNRYDIIFLDHHLKDGIGWDIAKMISRDPGKYGNPRIIAMSGSIIMDKNAEGREYYSMFMPKPFEISEINNIIERTQEGVSSNKPA